MPRTLFLSILFLLFFVPNASATEFRLWFYLPTNLLVDANVDRGIELLHRAANAGYTGVLLTDSKFCRWGQLPDRYESNVKRFRDECRRLNLECFVAVCPVGYSNDLLNLDPNLAEGLPVIDAPFVVKDGQLVPEQPTTPILKNGGFEEHRNNNPVGWGFVDAPGATSFIDPDVKTEGSVSLRMQESGDNPPPNWRAMQAIQVEPFRYYHVSVMVKTENFPTADTRIAVLTTDGRSLNLHMPRLKPTDDWRRIDITFNSLEYKTVNLYFGTWGAKRGKIWWNDAKVEPAGFVNVLRRDGTPFTVKSEDGTTVFTEVRDFGKIVDPQLGNDPYLGCYTAWHEPPVVRIPSEKTNSANSWNCFGPTSPSTRVRITTSRIRGRILLTSFSSCSVGMFATWPDIRSSTAMLCGKIVSSLTTGPRHRITRFVSAATGSFSLKPRSRPSILKDS